MESVTTQDLRNYFTVLQANHSMGGVHCFFRSVRAFLNWYETENDDSGWKNTIKKVRVKAPYLEPLEPADIGAVKEILNTFIPNIICNFWIYSRQTIFTIFV